LLEAGGLRVESDVLDLPKLFAQIEADTEATRGDKPNVRVQVDVQPTAQQLRIDRGKLKVIITKVIDNAIKFTETGTVTVGARPRDGGVEITVTDTGIGITPDVLPIIFEPFRQGEPGLTRRYGGVGIGLYVARRLLDLIGGRITVASTPGRGSTFHIWVPESDGVSARCAQAGAA
jgi:signal transduction histidine kinase